MQQAQVPHEMPEAQQQHCCPHLQPSQQLHPQQRQVSHDAMESATA